MKNRFRKREKMKLKEALFASFNVDDDDAKRQVKRKSKVKRKKIDAISSDYLVNLVAKISLRSLFIFTS